MKDEKLIEIIGKNYYLNVTSVEKVKNTYKIDAKEGRYCIKIIKYQFPHFYFILSAIIHLQRRGFKTIPDIVNTKYGELFIKLEGKFAYLTKWIPSRESNYDNPIELINVAEKLGELHNCSEGFNITGEMKPRIGWFSWINVFETRRNEILDFKKRINQKAHTSKFDKLYLSIMDDEINRATQSIVGLENSNYIQLMEKEVLKRGFCHHDYANHNILISNNNDINIIDFDYCILDTHLHDLCSLMIRAMKNGKWDYERANNIIQGYKISNTVSLNEYPIMKEFMRFPQAYWQLGIQVYWEQQSWGEELFLERLSKYIDDRNEREEFIREFFL